MSPLAAASPGRGGAGLAAPAAPSSEAALASPTGTEGAPKMHVRDQAGMGCTEIKGPGVICFRRCFASASTLP